MKAPEILNLLKALEQAPDRPYTFFEIINPPKYSLVWRGGDDGAEIARMTFSSFEMMRLVETLLEFNTLDQLAAVLRREWSEIHKVQL